MKLGEIAQRLCCKLDGEAEANSTALRCADKESQNV